MAVLSPSAYAQSAGPPADPLAVSRQNFHDARAAIDERRWDDYQRLRSTLDDYPLAIYLDYWALSRQLHQADVAAVQQFLQRAKQTTLGNRLLRAYLDYIGKRKRWGDFLTLMPSEPNSTVLKCYYFRAQLQAGNKAEAWRGAGELWVHGRSRPDECDPLFDRWIAAGELTDEFVWQRMLAAFAADQRSLMRYVARRGSAALQPWTDKLQQVHARPERLVRTTLPADSPYSADIATRALVYLARYSPEKALAQWQALQGRLTFSDAQSAEVEGAIALRSLFAKTDAHRTWLHGALTRLRDDKLTGIRLRWALEEQDWVSLKQTVALLSEAQREEPVWRYWQAQALRATGDTEAANTVLNAVAQERSYYGFLAAEQVGLPYAYEHQPMPEITDPQLLQLAALQRIEELRFHEEFNHAHAEWSALLARHSPEALAQLARIAVDKGWPRKGIDAASRARLWDALDIRFPAAYSEVFEFHGKQQSVPDTELRAIARRESAFFAQARSPVGARGLMQIMPATGRQVAASLNVPHSTERLYEVEHNVRLGSAYYRELLDRFQGNRIFALTAYNAGPHRVDRWQNDAADAQSVEVWVETIPFKETRNYVQAVLAYNLLFQYLQGKENLSLLTPAERNHAY